jgi:hypothetical protein
VIISSQPQATPRRWSLATETAGDTTIIYHILLKHNNNSQGEAKMSREEMIAYIMGRLESADDIKVEQYYWFFQFEEE